MCQIYVHQHSHRYCTAIQKLMASNPSTPTQSPRRSHGQAICPNHQSEVVFFCEDCGGDLICIECAISTHEDHKVNKVCDAAPDKIKRIQDYISKVEESELPNIQYRIESVNAQFKENTKHFKTVTDKIKCTGEKLKAQIDRLLKEFIKTSKALEQNNFDLLSQYKQALDTIHSRLSRKLEYCKKVITSGDDIKILDTEKNLDWEPQKPLPPQPKFVDFIEGNCTTTQLQEHMGNFKIQNTYRPTVKSEIKHSYHALSLEKNSSDSVWVSYHQDRNIVLINTLGEEKLKIRLGSDVKDISVSPVTGNLWLCCCSTVYEVNGKKHIKRFTTDCWPWSLCMTPDNNVVLGSYQDVTLYSSMGQELHSTQAGWKPVIVVPIHIAVCTSTGDIAVCDWDQTDKGGQGKPHVVVLNSKLEQKYRYYGPPKVLSIHTMEYEFCPIDITYDMQGCLLVADKYNKCIHLVGSKGNFLSMVYTEKLKPRVLTLIEEDQLCVGFDDKTIQVIQYRASQINPVKKFAE